MDAIYHENQYLKLVSKLSSDAKDCLRKYFHDLILSNLQKKVPSSRGVMLAYAYVCGKKYASVEVRIREQKECYQPQGLSTFHFGLATEVAEELHKAITALNPDGVIWCMDWRNECRKLVLAWFYPDLSWAKICFKFACTSKQYHL